MTTTLRRCSIDGCERPRYGYGQCKLHWRRTKRTGDPHADRPPMVRRTTCEVEGCDRKHRGNGLCGMHRMRLERHGDLAEPPQTQFPTGPEHAGWIGDQITYKPAHFRVVALHESASHHLCINCGGQAQDWAYDHRDPDELTCHTSGLLYSANPDRYVPLCRRCHKRFDEAFRRGDLESVMAVVS